MYDSKPVSTPVNPDVKLVPSESPDDVCNQPMYQTVVGSLLYLSTTTRPDIAYAVSRVTRFCGKPTCLNEEAVVMLWVNYIQTLEGNRILCHLIISSVGDRTGFCSCIHSATEMDFIGNKL